MSVHRDRENWRVKYRDASGRQRSRSFTRKGDANDFDSEMRRRLQLGPAMARELDRSALTLEQFIAAGFRSHAATLSRVTRKHYEWACRNHLAELMDEPLINLDVPALAAHQAYLLDEGRTPTTIRQSMLRLSGILQIAAEHGHIPGNPARAVRKVPADRTDEVRPLAPAELETLIDGFEGRARAIAVLAGHLGLRPLEVRSVPWQNFDGRTLTVGRARTKVSAARTRVITVPKATAAELKRWQLESGRPGPREMIIGPLTKSGLIQWGWKHLGPAARDLAGRDDVTLYTLRHTHASALHYCGWTVPAAARRMGHGGPLHLSTYAHVIDALEGQPRAADLDALIDAARNTARSGVPPMFRKTNENP